MSLDHPSAQPNDGRRHRVPEMRDLRFRILPVPNLQLHGHAPTRLPTTHTMTTVHGLSPGTSDGTPGPRGKHTMHRRLNHSHSHPRQTHITANTAKPTPRRPGHTTNHSTTPKYTTD